MEYKNIQVSKQNRYCNNVSCHKILKIEKKVTGSSVLTVGCNPRISGGEMQIPVSGEYQIGQWVDLVLSYTAYNGKITSYSTTFVGLTPAALIPTDGREWGK